MSHILSFWKGCGGIEGVYRSMMIDTWWLGVVMMRLMLIVMYGFRGGMRRELKHQVQEKEEGLDIRCTISLH